MAPWEEIKSITIKVLHSFDKIITVKWFNKGNFGENEIDNNKSMYSFDKMIQFAVCKR